MPKRLYAGSFVPYRKPKNPTVVPIDRERADFVRIAATELQTIVLAMDILPDQGAITVRDSAGVIWEVTVQRSDAKYLQGEADFKERIK